MEYGLESYTYGMNSNSAASTKLEKGGPRGSPFFNFGELASAEPAPEGKGRRAPRGVVSGPQASEAQIPAASTKKRKGLLERVALFGF